MNKFLKNKYSLVILSTLFFPCNGFSQSIKSEIELDSLYFVENKHKETQYLSYKNNKFKTYVKSELFNNLSLNIKSDLNLKELLYLEIDNSLYNLTLSNDYSIYIPSYIYYDENNKNLMIIEFQILSFISSFDYHFLVLDFRDKKKLYYSEIVSYSTKNNIEKYFRGFKNKKYFIKEITLKK